MDREESEIQRNLPVGQRNRSGQQKRSGQRSRSPREVEHRRQRPLSEGELERRRQRPLTLEERNRRRRRMLRKQRERRIRKIKMIFFSCVFLFFALFVHTCYAMFIDTVYKTCVVEAGNIVEASDLEKRGIGNIKFTKDSIELDTSTLGVYEVKVRKGLFKHKCEITVQDTVAPAAEGMEKYVGISVDVDPKDCVTNVSDVTSLTYKFLDEIDKENSDPQEIRIAIEDEGGNVTTVTSTIIVSDDTEGPVITVREDISSAQGDSIAYLQYITANDDSGEDCELEIDNSGVDTSTVGEYTITITATDWVGNVSILDTVITVYEKTVEEELVEEYAQNILAEITDDSMSDTEICMAIFNWCTDSIVNTGTADKDDWVMGAYLGFTTLSGDCYTYFATAKALMDAAGITNMGIVKIPTDISVHYWNLVDLGDGWLHFDASRRDGTVIFLWTDEELMEYSDDHNYSHNYDPSLYPDIL